MAGLLSQSIDTSGENFDTGEIFHSIFLSYRQKTSQILGNQFNTKYVEVISLQLICAMINSIPSLISIPVILLTQEVTIFVFVTWLLHYPLLFL